MPPPPPAQCPNGCNLLCPSELPVWHPGWELCLLCACLSSCSSILTHSPLLWPQGYHVLRTLLCQIPLQSTPLSMIYTAAAPTETRPCLHLVGQVFWVYKVCLAKKNGTRSRRGIKASLHRVTGERVEGWIQVGQPAPVLQPIDH